MTLPDARTLCQVIDESWPCETATRVGPWMIRNGKTSGSRTSAATAEAAVGPGDLKQGADAMRALGQTPLFMIREGEAAVDALLAKAGYAIKDPVVMYAARARDIATQRPPPVTSFEVWPPLAVQLEVWQAGGINAARVAVMDRAPAPKTTLLGRLNDEPAGTVFVGSSRGCAMIHALEVSPAHRRQGLAAHLTQAAAFWALDQGLDHLTLVTTADNAAANGLYTSLGMVVVGQYHYRVLTTGDTDD